MFQNHPQAHCNKYSVAEEATASNANVLISSLLNQLWCSYHTPAAQTRSGSGTPATKNASSAIEQQAVVVGHQLQALGQHNWLRSLVAGFGCSSTPTEPSDAECPTQAQVNTILKTLWACKSHLVAWESSRWPPSCQLRRL